ncbi:helix-turn-helix domain-containing protein [Litoribacterium kuwaitense]|uniref:helix-turn-helix domain-containing protein n=1 Tax=Litoribacterium kuwaitense TaxID=1398745 RepID=UPI001BA87DDD|nr:helix-turn-helix transcriptional regulator [Litoribacterium kuwaitense]
MTPINLQRIRQEHNVSRQAIADQLGLTPQAYGNYENGRRQPSLSILCQLADLFNVSLDELVGRQSPLNSPLRGRFVYVGELSEENLLKIDAFVKELHRKENFEKKHL